MYPQTAFTSTKLTIETPKEGVPLASFWCLYVNFEHVIAGWVISIVTMTGNSSSWDY